MNNKNFLAVLVLAFVMVGCSVNVSDIQSIDIDYYAENDKNIKLAEDLMFYDPRYIAFKIAAVDEDSLKGMRLGYFIRSSDGKPSYRVTYNLKNLSVSSKLSELKRGFEEYIPKLAASHVSKASLFTELEPLGMKWSNSLFAEEVDSLYAESSTLLKEAISPEQFSKVVTQLSGQYGSEINIGFVRAQYYEAFEDMPESVSLFYKADFAEQKVLMIRVSMHQQSQKWRVMGFNIQPVQS